MKSLMRHNRSATSDIKLRGKKIFLRPPTRADFSEYAALMKISELFFRALLPKFKGRSCYGIRSTVFGFVLSWWQYGLGYSTDMAFSYDIQETQGTTLP